MHPDSDAPKPDDTAPDVPNPAWQEAASAPAPAVSRRVAWLVAALLAAAALALAWWGVRKLQSDRAIADVERSLADLRVPATAPRTPVTAPQAPTPASQPLDVPPPTSATSAAAAPAGDRLPPLALPGQRVPAAVLRDLPEWVSAQVGAPASPPPQTSGTSGDESAAPAVPPERQPPARREAQPRTNERQYRAVFARCPGPGESGAVECRRAVCAGAARKSSACAPYLGE